MPKIDVYLRSVERFGAAGAILTSGQAITLRFPQGDRHATQVTPHDQLVQLVMEIAPAPALALIDANRPAKFEIDSGGTRYALEVTPKPNLWQVVIAAATSGAPATPAPVASAAARPAPRAAAPDGDEMVIERGQYADAAPTARTASGSVALDQWTTSARSARATDVYLATGAHPLARVNGELQQLGDRALDAETISRELGVVAPAEARGAWSERGGATFTYNDGMGRVRATLSRDHRGPGASLRLLVAEPPALDRLGIGREVNGWLDARGLVLIAGPSGVGKTTTLSALVKALGDKGRRVVMLEDPIEILATSPLVSQRAIGEHVQSVTAGVAAAIREGADTIVVGTVPSADAAIGVLDAVMAGHLVIATLSAVPAQAADHLIECLPHERRDLARTVLGGALLGTIAPVVKGGSRSFEVVAKRGG